MPNILIVEDDININNLLCEVLMKAGYTCEQAFSGTEAKLLLNIKEKAYTLVLLDLMLPGASGEEVLKEIRKHGSLPVIVLTAKDSIDDKIGVLTDGADDYITKPFEIREVLARIQVQLRHIEAETKNEAETKGEAEAETEAETEVKIKAGIQKGQGSGRLEFRDMVLTRSTFEVSIGGRVLPKITKQEFAIL
uniref:response regulator transcription factor n=1 Tax=Lachnospira sp. TaxID=2049031 RepID=UPI0040276345